MFPLAWLVEYQLQNNPHLMDLLCLKKGILRNVLTDKKYPQGLTQAKTVHRRTFLVDQFWPTIIYIPIIVVTEK